MDIVQVDLSITGMEYLVSVSAYPYLMAQKRAGMLFCLSVHSHDVAKYYLGIFRGSMPVTVVASSWDIV